MTECRCGRPTRDDAYLCDECREGLRQALGDMAWADSELETTMTRQKAAAMGGGTKGAETPLPWHERASEARRHLHALLVSWVRFCGEESVRGVPAHEPRDNVRSLAAWLLHCVDGLALHDIGPEAHDEITDALASARAIVFWKKQARTYLGACGLPITDGEGNVLLDRCGGEVYAEPEDINGACDDCGQEVGIQSRKRELETLLDDRLCTAAELARMAVFLGLDVPRDSVRKKVLYWHRHNRIVQRRTEAGTNAPMFRYGEVRPLLYAEFGARTA